MDSRTRRRLSGMLIAGGLAAISASGIAMAKAGRVEQNGIFALVGGATPQIVSKFWADHANRLSATLKVRQFTLDGKPILDYDVDMEHIMHMVIVRDDFATFSHVHPDFDTTTGTFWQDFTKDPNHRYYVYADSTPHSIGQQVFRFTLASDGPVAKNAPALSVSTPLAAAGPYTVKLSKTTLPANRAKNVNVTVLEGSEPARDLSTYLGAAAHAVFINTSTLAYVHVHPMLRKNGAAATTSANANADATAEVGMSGEAGPFMRMMVPALSAGTYKLWIQFSGNDKLYTVPFTMLVR